MVEQLGLARPITRPFCAEDHRVASVWGFSAAQGFHQVVTGLDPA
jgi:hypothetical protein